MDGFCAPCKLVRLNHDMPDCITYHVARSEKLSILPIGTVGIVGTLEEVISKYLEGMSGNSIHFERTKLIFVAKTKKNAEDLNSVPEKSFRTAFGGLV